MKMISNIVSFKIEHEERRSTLISKIEIIHVAGLSLKNQLIDAVFPTIYSFNFKVKKVETNS
jgi:hypothetical protein